MFSTLKVSISALFFTSSLVLGHDGECYVAPCGRVENYYASRFDACYGTTVAATNAICAGRTQHRCAKVFITNSDSVWNNNGLIEGAGGPDPKPGNEPCVCRDLGPGGTTGMGGIAENLDLDWWVLALTSSDTGAVLQRDLY